MKGIKVLLNETECENLDVSDTILTCDVPDLLAIAEEESDLARRRRRRQAEEDAPENKNIISKSINITVCLDLRMLIFNLMMLALFWRFYF